MKGIRAKLDYALKHSTVLNRCFRACAGTAIRIVGLFVPTDRRSVLFTGLGGKYNDSTRVIYETMLADPRCRDFRYYWAVDTGEEAGIPGDCTVVRPDTFRYFVAALKCGYWVACVNIERGLRFKKKKIVYLNTWHGIPIKTVGNEAKGRKDYDFSHIDYFCISDEYEKDLYDRSFRVKESQLLRCGLPRNDELYTVTEEKKALLKESLGLPADKKVILYAPTWRDSSNGGKTYDIKPPVDIGKWERELGEEYVLLFRTHPNTNRLLGVEFNGFVRDMSAYPRINDLMIVSDLLISDYSAAVFDYAVLERPVLCFAYDLDEYRRERGFAMDYEAEMPSPVFGDEDSVLAAIRGLDREKAILRVRKFKEKYLTYGGKAAEQCVDALLRR